MRVVALVVTAFAAGKVLHAQCQPAAQISHVTPFRVRWEVGNALVTPDSSRGVGIWFATNYKATVGGHTARRQLVERFEPDSLIEWLVFTRQLLTLTGPLPNDTSTVVKSGILRGLGGGIIVAARIRKGDKLSKEARVFMAPKSDTSFMFEIDRASLDSLLDVAEAAAQRSGFHPPSGGRDTLEAPNVREPEPLPTKREMRYPPDLLSHGIDGEVWARYCIAADGSVDLSTFHAELSDDPAFERAVKEYLAAARYQPATRQGTPVPFVVSQRFLFGFGR